MALESKLTEQQLFDQLISSLVHTTWVSLGKIPYTLRHFIKTLNILDNSLTKNFLFFFLKNRLTGFQGKYDK